MRSANNNQNQHERCQSFIWFSCLHRLHQGLWSLSDQLRIKRWVVASAQHISAWKHETGICHWHVSAGKTSTLKSLCNEAFDASEASTHGVENAVCTTDSWRMTVRLCKVVQGCGRWTCAIKKLLIILIQLSRPVLICLYSTTRNCSKLQYGTVCKRNGWTCLALLTAGSFWIVLA